MQTRQEKILACIDPATQKGLEIGALNKPIVTREMGDIRYVDHAENLQRFLPLKAVVLRKTSSAGFKKRFNKKCS